MKHLVPVLAIVTLAACSSPGHDLLVPEDIDVDWDARFDATDDGVGVLIPIDVMVYEAETGVPQAGIELLLEPTSGVAHVLHPDEAQRLAPELDDEPDAYWDVWDSHRVTFEPDLRDLEPDLHIATDADGLARAMVWVDAFGTGPGGEFTPVPIVVSADGADRTSDMTQTFALIPR